MFLGNIGLRKLAAEDKGPEHNRLAVSRHSGVETYWVTNDLLAASSAVSEGCD
jgi:hypothetical protein